MEWEVSRLVRNEAKAGRRDSWNIPNRFEVGSLVWLFLFHGKIRYHTYHTGKRLF